MKIDLERVSALLDSWALPPRHPLIRFLSGSSEVIPSDPYGLLESTEDERREAVEAFEELLAYLGSEMDATAPVVDFLRRVSVEDLPLPEPTEEEEKAIRAWGRRLARARIS